MQRVRYLCIVLLTLLVALPVSAQLRAFPGAEGWGAMSMGARGGNEYELRFVTNHQRNMRVATREPTGSITISYAMR